MRQCLTYVLLACFLVLLLPTKVFSAAFSGQILIENEQHWTSSPANPITSLIIGQNGHLFIEPGVLLKFSLGAVFQVSGQLTIQGNAQAPVRFTATRMDQRWQGLRVSGRLEAEYFELSYADQAISITGSSGNLRQLNLLDNRDNTIVISGGRGGSFSITESRFERIFSGDDAGSSGLLIRRDELDTTMSDVVFREERIVAALPDFIGIKIEATDANTNTMRVSHSQGCWMFAFMGHYQIGAVVGFNRDNCHTNQVPLIFVPGFGASIDLESLLNPYFRNYDQKKWWFLPALTPAYQTFIRAVRERAIPYSVARYDWRLPANQIAANYLEPVINEAKKKYGVSKVNIVAHSYGGIVARSYIQGDHYRDDVLSLITLGTPHYGAYKAYPVWQAGELPSDWEIMKVLLQYYRYRGYNPFAKDVTVIRTFISSVSDLQPVYPALKRNGAFLPPENLNQQNQLLLDLNAQLELLKQRARVVTYYSDSTATPTWTSVGPPGSASNWPDGKPEGKLEMSPGDGTVPVQSAVITGVQQIRVSGTHFDLPKTAAKSVLEDLNPARLPYQPSPIGGLGWSQKPVVWYYADCPVVMVITAPDGTTYSSATSQQYWDPDLISDPTLAGLAKNDEMVWMAVPELPGTYTVTLTATADTEVRYWRGGEQPKVKELLKAGEQWVTQDQLTALKPVPSAKPSAEASLVPSPSSTDSINPEIATSDIQTSNTIPNDFLGFQFDWPFRYGLNALQPLDLPRLISYRFFTPEPEASAATPNKLDQDMVRFGLISVIGIAILIMLRRWQK